MHALGTEGEGLPRGLGGGNICCLHRDGPLQLSVCLQIKQREGRRVEEGACVPRET